MAVHNKLTDLHDMLMAQLEVLSNEDLSEKELNEEIKRSKAMVGVSRAITANANTLKDMVKMQLEFGRGTIEAPELLQIENKKGESK